MAFIRTRSVPPAGPPLTRGRYRPLPVVYSVRAAKRMGQVRKINENFYGRARRPDPGGLRAIRLVLLPDLWKKGMRGAGHREGFFRGVGLPSPVAVHWRPMVVTDSGGGTCGISYPIASARCAGIFAVDTQDEGPVACSFELMAGQRHQSPFIPRGSGCRARAGGLRGSGCLPRLGRGGGARPPTRGSRRGRRRACSGRRVGA